MNEIRVRSFGLLAAMMVLALVGVSEARGREPSAGEQEAAQREFKRLAGSRLESARQMAADRLRGMDFAWRVELLGKLIQSELRRQDRRERETRAIPIVAATAIEVLGTSRAHDAVGALVDAIVAEKRREIRTAMILALGAIQLGRGDDELPWSRIEPVLDHALAAGDDAEEVMAAVDAYAGLGRADRVVAILAHRFHEEPRVRAAVIAATAALFDKQEPQGLEQLVEVLEAERGALRASAMQALTRMTGWDCRFDVDCWRGRIAALRRGQEPPPSDPSQETVATYEDIPLTSERLLFVIDCSSSMAGGKWQQVTTELKRAIGGLSENTSFDILFFSDDVVAWQGELTIADEANRVKAQKRVERQFPIKGSQTDLFGALTAAFARAGRGVRSEKGGVGVDTIVLVTDGSPTIGEVSLRTPRLDERGEPRLDDKGDPIPIGQKECYDRIARAVAATNRFKRVALHVIGIGHPDEGLAESLLQLLADESGGSYRRVLR